MGLWKSTALPHFLQNLRYIQSTTDIKKLQTSLNLSLARTPHVYGDHTALLADTDVPPLTLIQYSHLAQLHFCLTKTRSDTLPATLFRSFNKSLALSTLHPSTLDYHIRNSLHQLHIDPLADPLPHMATLPHKRRERAYRNILRTTISTLWRMEILTTPPSICPTLIVGRLPTSTLPGTTSSAVIFSNLYNTFAHTLTNYPYSTFEPKPPPTSHLTSTLPMTTHTLHMTNAIAPLTFPSRS